MKTIRMETQLVATEILLDKQILINVYEQHSTALFRYAYRWLGDKDAAEDCVADTFSRMLSAVKNGLGPNENIKAYLFRVAHNWIMDYFRRKPSIPVPLEAELHASPESDPSHTFLEQMKKERVRDALRKLPRDQQQVIALRFLEDWSHDEIAQLAGKTVEATRALQYRALTTLRRLLIEKEDESYDEKSG